MVVVTTLPRGSFTAADLESMPDDGHRYEVIDGVLIVSAAPVPRHQVVLLGLYRLMHEHAPDDVWVLVAPVDVVLAEDTAMEPDLLVARKADFSEKNLPAAPLLAVEVLSPSTRLFDLNLKKARFERAGVPSYWVVDPDEPRVTAWELRDGAYVEVADVAGPERWDAILPFPVAIVPGELAG